MWFLIRFRILIQRANGSKSGAVGVDLVAHVQGGEAKTSRSLPLPSPITTRGHVRGNQPRLVDLPAALLIGVIRRTLRVRKEEVG